MRAFIGFLFLVFGGYLLYKFFLQGGGFSFAGANAAPVLNKPAAQLKAPTPPSLPTVPNMTGGPIYPVRTPVPPSVAATLPLGLPENLDSPNLFTGPLDNSDALRVFYA